MNVGVIGLSIIGTPMAANPVAVAHSLQVFDMKPIPASVKDKGLRFGPRSGGANRCDHHCGPRHAPREAGLFDPRNLNGGFRTFQ